MYDDKDYIIGFHTYFISYSLKLQSCLPPLMYFVVAMEKLIPMGAESFMFTNHPAGATVIKLCTVNSKTILTAMEMSNSFIQQVVSKVGTENINQTLS